MLGLNVFSMLVFIAINVYAATLCKNSEEKRERALKSICVMLLAFNLCKYTLSPVLGMGLKVPVEFSSVAYFLVPLIMLTGIKKMKCWAVYSGLMAGFFYYAAMILSGGKIYAEYPHIDTYLSLCCHGSLYLMGLVGIKTQKLKPSGSFILLLGVIFVGLNACLLRPIADDGTRLLIYELIDGKYLAGILPSSIENYLYYINYTFLTSLVLLSVRLFYKLNKAQYEKTYKNNHKNAPAETGYRIPA